MNIKQIKGADAWSAPFYYLVAGVGFEPTTSGSSTHLPQNCLGIVPRGHSSTEKRWAGNNSLLRGVGKARRGAPGARFAEVWTDSLRLPRADAPGISLRFLNSTNL